MSQNTNTDTNKDLEQQKQKTISATAIHTGTLDPYGLLGVTVDSTPGQVRHAYYDLSRLVHPDKGGCAKDMIVVHCAYKYVMAQVSEVNRSVSIEDLEERFASFCREQLDESVPMIQEAPFFQSNLVKFNQHFDALSFNDKRDGLSSHPDGYADMMESSEYHTDETEKTCVVPPTFVPFQSPKPECVESKSHSSPNHGVSNGYGYTPFTTHITTYSEPMTASTDTQMTFSELALSVGLDDYGTSRPFEMTDYRCAFTTTMEPIIEVDQHLFSRTYEQLIESRTMVQGY